MTNNQKIAFFISQIINKLISDLIKTKKFDIHGVYTNNINYPSTPYININNLKIINNSGLHDDNHELHFTINYHIKHYDLKQIIIIVNKIINIIENKRGQYGSISVTIKYKSYEIKAHDIKIDFIANIYAIIN